MNAEPMALVRAIRRMNKAGFAIRVAEGELEIAPIGILTDTQRGYLREHKAALVALLTDAEHLAGLLGQAGNAGLGWREGTPPEWNDGYLLAVGEILYSQTRMVNRLGRRYAVAVAPPLPDYSDAGNVPEIAPQVEEMA